MEDGQLTRRIRNRSTSQAGSSAPSDSNRETFDEELLAIGRGTSIAKVRRILGAPEHDEEVFEGVANPEVVLGYGAWTLSFRDGKLIERTKF